MRPWGAVLVLGLLAAAAGGALEFMHLHHTIGLGAIGLGVLLIVVGAAGILLGAKPAKVEEKRMIAQAGRRGGYRRTLVAVGIVVLIGVGTYYGTSYLAGIQPGVPPNGSTTTAGTQPTGIVTGGSSATSTLYSGTVTTLVQKNTSTTSTSRTTSSNTFTNTSLTGSSATSTSTTTTSSESSSSSSTGSRSTTVPNACVGTTPSVDGSAIEYNVTGASATVYLTTHQAQDLVVVFTSTVTTPEGTNSTPPVVTGVGDGRGSLSFHLRGSFVTFEPDSGSNKFAQEEWYAVASSPLTNDPITVTLSSPSQELTVTAFAVVGVNTSSPFDPGVKEPVGVSGTTTGTISAGISIVCPHDIIVGSAVLVNPFLQSGEGFSVIGSDNGHAPYQDVVVEYVTVSSPQSGLQVTFVCSPQPLTHVWLIIADALN